MNRLHNNWLFFYASFLYMLIIAGGCSVDKQEVFVDVITTGVNDDISELIMFNDASGIAIGGDNWVRGLSWQTDDGGSSWNIDSISGKKLFGMDDRDGDIVAIGIDGHFVKYTEGEEWIFHRLQYWDILRDIVITDKDQYIAIGGIAFINGYIYLINSSYNVDTVISFEHELQAISHISGSEYLAVGFGAAYHTSDYGLNWELTDLTGDYFYDVQFFDDSFGMILGESGTILKTTDGGTTWKNISDGKSLFSGTRFYRDLLVIDQQEVYACGDRGLIVRSLDGGDNWTKLETGLDLNFKCLSNTSTSVVLGADSGRIAILER